MMTTAFHARLENHLSYMKHCYILGMSRQNYKSLLKHSLFWNNTLITPLPPSLLLHPKSFPSHQNYIFISVSFMYGTQYWGPEGLPKPSMWVRRRGPQPPEHIITHMDQSVSNQCQPKQLCWQDLRIYPESSCLFVSKNGFEGLYHKMTVNWCLKSYVKKNNYRAAGGAAAACTSFNVIFGQGYNLFQGNCN